MGILAGLKVCPRPNNVALGHILQAYFESPCWQFHIDLKLCLFYCIYNNPVLVSFQLPILDNGLVFRPLDYLSIGLRFKTTIWLHGPPSLSSKLHQKNTRFSRRLLQLKVNILLILSLYASGS